MTGFRSARVNWPRSYTHNRKRTPRPATQSEHLVALHLPSAASLVRRPPQLLIFDSMLSAVTLLLGGYVPIPGGYAPIPVSRELASGRTASAQLLTDAERFAGRHWVPGVGWLQGPPPSAPAPAPLEAPRVVQPPPTAPVLAPPASPSTASTASTGTATATATAPANAGMDGPAAFTANEMISELAERSLTQMRSVLRLEER